MLLKRRLLSLVLLLLTTGNFVSTSKSSSNENGYPDFSQPIKNVTVPLGREAVLTCAVSDLGDFRVGWIKLEDQTILSLHTQVLTPNPRIYLTHDNHKLWQLHIRQVKEQDRGCYMCQVNTKVMKKQIGCLDVLVPPDIVNEGTSGDVTVHEGENATLRCQADGRPPPRIVWRREETQSILLKETVKDALKIDSFQGEVIHLQNVQRNQMGAYMCIASNDVPPAVSKRIMLNVNFDAKMAVPNQVVGSPLETDVQFECAAEIYPVTNTYWTLNKTLVLVHGNKYKIDEWRDSYIWYMRLTVRKLTKSDIGFYDCIATNDKSRIVGHVRLYEIKLTTIPPTTTTTSTTTTTTTTTTTRRPRTTTARVTTENTPVDFLGKRTTLNHLEVPNAKNPIHETHGNEIGALNNPSSGRRSDIISSSATVVQPVALLVAALILVALIGFNTAGAILLMWS